MLEVVDWPIDKLIPYARNPRKNDEVIPQMMAAITEFGFRIPIVAKSDGIVIDGHLRLKAAQRLGLKTVPVALADDLTDAQIKAFRLLANKSANWAEWDDELLSLEMLELNDMDYDLSLTGFSESELLDLMGTLDADPDKDPDELPNVPEVAFSQLGDMWILGAHKVRSDTQISRILS